MEIVLIRHGQTYGNINKEYSGFTDTMLTELGKEQLHGLREEKRYPDVEQYFTSPLTRCKDTLSIIYPSHTEFVEVEELKEFNFGIFEGKTHLELDGDDIYQQWINNFKEFEIPGGDSVDTFRQRVSKGVNVVLEVCAANAYGKVAVICHSGVIKAVLHHFFDNSKEFPHQVENGLGYVINVKTMEVYPL